MSPRLARPFVALSAAAALTLATAGPAAAVPSYFDGTTTVQISGDATNENITVTCTGGHLTQGAFESTATCAALRNIDVFGGEGADTINLSALTAADFPSLTSTRINGGSGEDEDFDPDSITGSPLSDRITAGYNDTVVAGDGADLVKGGATVNAGSGDDIVQDPGGSVDLGPGDDVLRNPADTTVGGPGFDTIEWDLSSNLGAPSDLQFNITLTNDTVQTQITQGSDSSGGQASVASIERFELTLLDGGSQSVDTTAFSGSVYLSGRGGRDVLASGPGNDLHFGGQGNDELTGGAGNDDLRGGAGDDLIQARDGQLDLVACGDGNDTAVVDAVDVVSNCEAVSLPVAQTSAVSGPKRVAKGKKAKFKFTGTDATSFQCKVDGRKWKKCSSPFKVKTQGLSTGKHTVRVRAIGATGPDTTPSKKTFKVA